MYKVEYVVVFRELPNRRSWLWRCLKPCFQHVELWREVTPGAWLRLDTALEFLSVEVYGDPPETLLLPDSDIVTLRYVGEIPDGKIRQPWRTGPVTCVELAAAFLGVRLPWYVRTPYQFYKFLRKRNGAQDENPG
jgi:hypothetical protein